MEMDAPHRTVLRIRRERVSAVPKLPFRKAGAWRKIFSCEEEKNKSRPRGRGTRRACGCAARRGVHGPPTRQVEQRPARICPALVLIPDPGGATHDAAAAAAVATRDGWWCVEPSGGAGRSCWRRGVRRGSLSCSGSGRRMAARSAATQVAEVGVVARRDSGGRVPRSKTAAPG
jgi:hypothetical protein